MLSENQTDADNQQERLRLGEESSETIRLAMSPARFMEDIVRSTWRHVELTRNSKPRKGKQYVELNEEKRDQYVVTFERAKFLGT